MSFVISKMIAHKLNLDGSGPILASSIINIDELEGDKEALDFFETHIMQSRGQGYVKKCQFLDIQHNTVKLNVEKIILNLENQAIIDQVFIEESQKLAIKLRKRITQTSSRSDGSLFVLLYSIDGENYIGILKMDPDTGIEVNDDLSISVRKDMLPSKRERLHKAALIICKEEYFEGELHLFALDRQKGSNEPAKYFINDFLNAKILPDNENLTSEYQKELFATFKDILPQDLLMEFNNRVKQTFSTGKYFTIEDSFEPLIRDLLPEDSRDMDLEGYKRDITRDMVKKFSTEVTGFYPVKARINPTIFQSSDRSIEIKIAPDADETVYEKEFKEDGTFVLTVYSDAEIEEKK
ncbi:nucleoid-associated protein [Enterococcus faecalis]|uniref:nucleoid-associated protein n=1 Tax=Enterococcus faecalis TaxID=1351 RepID=UPI00045941C1|nr:nucleoid-associated protein [Enterococcus faecalis]EGO9051628.1 hypothetical protein [Enterococcus faecalis]EHH3130684.1 nucleoid-associated protein [Enterococcus faecalis]EHS2085469.1 nucleoid-associated protein [Enterococcus faecalis]KAJ61896.1 hypothetical protein P783_0193 [Enterococcus faecalis GA2]HAP2777977.1 nucleoid-associated protein [Enterococcus faecalis]